MNFSKKTIQQFQQIETPFYYYDLQRLTRNVEAIQQAAQPYGFRVHYALKANANTPVLDVIKQAGMGADCVSGNEITRAAQVGFMPEQIYFAGVGKSDKEIQIALLNNIGAFNIESLPEIENISLLAQQMGKNARIAIRINPNLDARTHHYITTGLEENKFGVDMADLPQVLELIEQRNNIELVGIHLHIGSQITDLDVFKSLCLKVNKLQEWFYQRRVLLKTINVGGGLGVDYNNPDNENFPDYQAFFKLFHQFLNLKPNQTLHFELGRAVVAQCGNLITKVLYVKQGQHTNFAVTDAGMTELIRPALYQAHHKIENITAQGKTEFYDVVGPICESSDVFGKTISMPHTKRGDLLAIRSAGAYGQVMASQYNLRDLVKAYYSTDLL